MEVEAAQASGGNNEFVNVAQFGLQQAEQNRRKKKDNFVPEDDKALQEIWENSED